MNKKFRIPRKKKKQIPKDTPYCYTSDYKMIYPENNGLPYYKIKCCPFYKNDPTSNIMGSCRLLNCEIEDQCKSCGQNYPKEW